mmetsp:Transcript_25481/g.69172  ORF Transcript_25481/g.69172 Transcript_25481/m.69172 type:complete len:98 (+) Transcript_25481:259-552(+)
MAPSLAALSSGLPAHSERAGFVLQTVQHLLSCENIDLSVRGDCASTDIFLFVGAARDVFLQFGVYEQARFLRGVTNPVNMNSFFKPSPPITQEQLVK